MVQFQEDVYKNVGVSEILPHLMKSLDAGNILAVQFLGARKVRLTFDDPEVCSAVLRTGLELEGLSVRLMPADDRYGEVLSVDHCYFDDFPSLCNVNRLVKIAQDIPGFFEGKAASVAFGTLVNCLSALFAAILVTVPQPAHFLVSAGAAASPVM